MKNIIYDQYRKLIRDSKYRWIVIIASAAYIISPIDLIPDFLPFVGWIDDGVVATVLVTELAAIVTEKMKAKKAGRSGTDSGTDEKDTVDVGSSRMK